MSETEIIKKGFNQGYSLQSSNPKLAVSIANSFKNPSHPYAKGFIAGSIELIKERGNEKHILDSINKEKRKSIDRDINL